MNHKPVNVWLFVVLSCLPFVALYPLLKLKKFWVMTIINIAGAMVLGAVVIGTMTLGVEYSEATFNLLYLVIIGFYLLDAPFVYHWSKEYNKKLENQATVNT